MMMAIFFLFSQLLGNMAPSFSCCWSSSHTTTWCTCNHCVQLFFLPPKEKFFFFPGGTYIFLIGPARPIATQPSGTPFRLDPRGTVRPQFPSPLLLLLYLLLLLVVRAQDLVRRGSSSSCWKYSKIEEEEKPIFVLFSWKAFIYTVQQQPKQQEGAKPRAIILPPSSSSSSFSHSSTSSSSSGVLLAQNSSLQFLF
jgi:hypothetical protein